ncbi:MAG: hypothetical protein LBV26_02955 [Bacteroidales bacterium]|nr:hypothetical protein [Bacteroidales bacterium]
MKTLLAIMLSGIIVLGCKQNTPAGIFSNGSDVGKPKMKGSATYNAADQSYAVKGGGYNIWFERDEFYFLYNKMQGDFILTANFEFTGQGKNVHRKLGWMVRETTDGKSPHITAALHSDGLTVMQWRPSYGAAMRDPEDELFADSSMYNIVQLERAGKTFTMRVAHNGQPFETVGSHEMDNMAGEVLAGLFVCAHDPDALEEARIWNVRIDRPVAENSGQTAGCRLETMNVSDGRRMVVYEKDSKFEAPNWMPDGGKLLFNMDGSLYKIPVTGGTVEKLNTGFADNNNNDHGISFDGKLLAISHQRSGMPGGGSTVYVLPLEGGTPQMVTEHTPSYWHGWNPNNEEVIYVAQRDGRDIYNIYKKPVSGGSEVALTDIGQGQHVDGCEYSPDGRHIYFNGNLTGMMQIWRMKPDGKDMEQLTDDGYNNWFPHVSPDGKWLVMLSYPADIDPNSHPSYKRVMLRIMPASGGTPEVIAYLYGGQGTINVPSWSPDSKQISFVSNK